MKTRIAIILALAVPSFSFAAVTVKNNFSGNYDITVKTNSDEVTMTREDVNGSTFTHLTLANTVTSGAVGSPALPMINSLLAVDASKSYDVTTEATDPVVYNDVLVYPKQADHKENDTAPAFAFNKAQYQANAWVGQINAKLLNMASIGHVSVLPIQVTPFEFNAATKTLRVYQNLTIHVRAREMGPDNFVRSAGPITAFERAQVSALALNGDEVAANVTEAVSTTLVISDAALGDLAKGYGALHPERTIKYVTLQAGTTFDKVLQIVKDAFNNDHIDSVVLYGDETHVPFAVWDSLNSDSYYTYLTGTNYANISIGRIPANTADDAKFLNEKLARYYENQRAGHTSNKIMLVAHAEEYPGKYTANQEAIRTAPNPRNLAYTTEYGGLDATDASVLAESPNNYAIINYRGHGSQTEWWAWDHNGASFGPNEVTQLTNTGSNMAVFFDIACENGTFQAPTRNMAENLLFLEPKNGLHRGAVTALGASSDSYTEINNRFDINAFGFLETVDDISVGNIVALANNKLVKDDNGQMNDNIKMYVLFGDPLLRPWRQ